MKNLMIVAGLLTLAFCASSCGRGSDQDVLARVGSSKLTADEFYASIPEQLLAVMSLEDQEEALRSWVKTELFYREGVRRGVGEEAAMVRRLREIERELVAEEYIKRFVEDIPDVSEEEARAYFEQHQDEYSLQVRLAHILVRSRQESDRALQQVRSGTPFETVAAAMSIDQTASMGGDLGYMRRGEMLHELEEAAFSLKVGDVSDVIPSSYGYHIVKVIDRHPGAGRPTFDSRYAAVMNFLTSRRRRGAFDERLSDLMGRVTVAVDTAALRVAARQRISDTAGDESSGNPDSEPGENDDAGAP